jgi:hypothetical protein
MLLAYQSGGQTSTGALPADPRKPRRCMFVDEIDQIAAAEPPSPWHSADNYNRAHPINAIDEVTIAINTGDPTTGCTPAQGGCPSNSTNHHRPWSPRAKTPPRSPAYPIDT